MAKFLVSIPEDLFESFEEYRLKNHYERTELIKGLIRAAISQDLKMLPTYNLNNNGKFVSSQPTPIQEPTTLSPIDIFEEAPKKLPAMDDWGNEVTESVSPTPARVKLAKVAKSLKPDIKRCPHGIAEGGYCKGCGGFAK